MSNTIDTTMMTDGGAQPDRPKSLRDEFAIAAMQGLITGLPFGETFFRDGVASAAYAIADDMIKERRETQT